MEHVTSRHNSTLKLARSLRRRRGREESGLFLAEGVRLAVQAAQSNAKVEAVITSKNLLRSEAGWSAAADLAGGGARHIELVPELFETISDRDNPQGIAVIAQASTSNFNQIDLAEGLCWVALLRPQDPGNVGTILRTVDAVGAAGIILLDQSTDPFDARCVRASMGAIFTTTIVRATSEVLQSWSRSNGVSLTGVTGSAETDYRSAHYERPLALILGSEREGLDPEVRVDQEVSIPMRGKADSLNLAVATGIILYEVLHRSIDAPR